MRALLCLLLASGCGSFAWPAGRCAEIVHVHGGRHGHEEYYLVGRRVSRRELVGAIERDPRAHGDAELSAGLNGLSIAAAVTAVGSMAVAASGLALAGTHNERARVLAGAGLGGELLSALVAAGTAHASDRHLVRAVEQYNDDGACGDRSSSP